MQDATAAAVPDTTEPVPPDGIMPVENAAMGLVPSATVIERLTILANAVAASGLGIGGCRTAGAAFYKMMLGHEHGIRPMTSLSSIEIIEGKGCLQALALAATVEARGLGKIEIINLDDSGCAVRVTKPELPDWFKLVLYTAKDAAAAGFIALDPSGAIVRDPKTGAAVSSKKNWRTNTHDMFVARAISRAYRRWFRVAALGIAYTTEELQDGDEDSGRPVAVELDKGTSSAPPWAAPAVTAPATPAPVTEPPMGPIAVPFTAPVDASPSSPLPPPTAHSDAPRLATPEQVDQARAMIGSLKIAQPDWAAIVQRFGGASIKDLTEARTGDLLKYLKALEFLQIALTMKLVKPDQLATALRKRGVSRTLDLPESEALLMQDRIGSTLTPFDRQKIGMDKPPQSALGNSEPSAGSASPPAGQELQTQAPQQTPQTQQTQAA